MARRLQSESLSTFSTTGTFQEKRAQLYPSVSRDGSLRRKTKGGSYLFLNRSSLRNKICSRRIKREAVKSVEKQLAATCIERFAGSSSNNFSEFYKFSADGTLNQTLSSRRWNKVPERVLQCWALLHKDDCSLPGQVEDPTLP